MIARLKGSYFAKLMMSHLALTMLLITLSGGLLLNKTADMITKEMRSTGEMQLASMRETLESQQLESYNSALLNKALSTVRVEAESEIQFFLTNGKGNNYYRITRLAQDLKTLSMSLPMLHNLSFYFANDNFVVDQYFHNSPDNSPQAKLLQSDKPILTHQWFVRDVATQSLDKENKIVITYVYTLPYMARAGQIKGYMIVDLDAEKLIASVGEHLTANGEKLVVMSADGQVIGASSEWEDSMLQLVRKHLPKQEEQMVRVDDNVITLLPADQSRLNWHYALLRPQTSVLLTTQKMKSEIWMAGLAIALLGAIVSYVVSRKVYGPFRYITQRVRSASGYAKSGHNEIGWLEQALGFLDKQRAVYMTEKREKQWREAILGNLDFTGEELLIPSEGCFMPVSLELEGMEYGRFAQLLVKSGEKSPLYEELLVLSANEAVIVYWCEEWRSDMEAIIRDRLQLAASAVPESFRYIAGFGTATNKLEGIPLSAAEAQTARRYGFLSEESGCISYRLIERRKGLYPELKLEPFDTLLRSGGRHELDQYLTMCETDLRGEEYSIEAIELVLMQLHLYASKAKMMLDGNENEPVAFVWQSTLGKAISELRQLSMTVVEQRTEKKNVRYERIFSGIKEYIDLHIHEDISLEQLSAITSYSKQFVCKLFKEELQLTFVEYLTIRRLEHAAQLLRTTTDPIGAIASRSGFRSSQYFSNKFKSKFGVTPVQYRSTRSEIRMAQHVPE
ncbi:response regulator transcription factor [Paenibacillus agaridevorans]|uniref:response regulator transcription factor n=1 Tax=Paenibacillus agaridevorans TaxID=171404 RepID=UPI001BE4D1AC|nr:response regulator transcription factor [Paenibacillus agaridevorans]